MKRLIPVLTTLLLIVLGAQNYFLKQAKTQLTIDNKILAKAVLKPAVPNKLYVFGCKEPSAAVLVFSNGKSYAMERAQLMKLKGRLPKDLLIIPYQHPDCRSSGT